MADPQAAGEASPMDEEPSPSEVPSEVYPLNILQMIRGAQQSNGLKHGDYSRYRQYCARRLRSLHKALKFLHGKGRFTKKKLELHLITDARYLHIPLVNAERAWAYAQDLKKDVEAAGGHDPDKRHHSIRRLSKAALWANELARLAAARCDARGALEAEAYASWMGGLLALEKETDWAAALAQLSKAKKLYSELAKVGDLDSQALCAAMAEEIEPSVRYCHYQISRAGGAGDAGDLLSGLERRSSSDAGARGVGMDMLQGKLAALQAEAQTQQAAGMSSFAWRCTEHPVRTERVRVALHVAAEQAAALDGAMAEDGGGGASIEASLAAHDRLVNALAEARSVVRGAIKLATSGAADSAGSAAAGEDLAALEVAVGGLLAERTLQRGEAAVADAAARWEAGAARAAAGQPKVKGERQSKPEDLIRLHDTLLTVTAELSELAGRLGGRSGEALLDACAAREAGYLAGRAYWLGHAYLGAGKWGEAAALFERAGQRVEEAAEKLEDLPKGEKEVRAALPGLRHLASQAAAYGLVAGAELAAESAAGEEEARRGLGGMGLAAQQQQAAGAAGSGRFMADALEEWAAFGGAPGGKGVRVFGAPYPPQPMPARPIMLDTAVAYIDYPDLQHRCGRTLEKKSTFARLFGGWGATGS